MKKRKKKIIRISGLIVFLIFLLLGISLGIKYLLKMNNNDINNNNNTYDVDNDSDNFLDIENNEEDMSNYTYDDVSILQYEDGTIMERLNILVKKDKRIKEIINNYNDYPEKLLEALSRNYELTTFVLDYNKKKGKSYANDIGEEDFTSVPLLYQWDERWGYASYGSSNIAISGCGPTSLAMVASYLLKDNTITPTKVARLAYEKGYYVEESGTTWDLMNKGPFDLGIKSRELPLSEGSIKNALANKHPIILNLRKGDFTINGHYLVVADYIDGKLKINDPNSKLRSNILWEYERIKNQIKNLWEFYL